MPSVASVDNLQVTVSDDGSTVVADGQIDSHTAPTLDEALAGADPTQSVSVDLSAITFVDSSGLRVLVRAHNRQAEGGGELVVLDPSEPVRRLLDITGLTSELRITPSVD